MRVLLGLVLNAIATVYFDGSLCHPVDPTFPTLQQSPRASCAAYIRLDDSREFLGGRILSECSSSTTSAEVEYEALILGLEGLQQQLSDDKLPAGAKSAICPAVVVLGDCKTVIQQMNGGSRPRKMESLYRRASQIAADIQARNVQISFQHIPRNQNLVSDRLCSTILAEKQRRDDRAAIQILSSLESNALRYSRRPAVYRYLSQLASHSSEWNTLVEIGERWSCEIQDVWPRNNKSRDELIVEAVAIQLVGLEALKKQKELLFQQRKHQYMLSLHAPISENVVRELSQAPSTSDLIIATKQLEFNDDECPPLILKWMQEAVDTSVWDDDYAYWMTREVEPL